jgi:glycine cleavage system H lipoate-binding protein|tara:strand:- start:2717 stop:3397 length:681 start_codon:yes stop_codon:yes gene_type:complete
MMDFDFTIGGYNIKGWMVAVALPVLSTVAGGVYWSYDTLQRFYGVEAGIAEVVEKSASFDAKAGALTTRITSVETIAQSNLKEVDSSIKASISNVDANLGSSIANVNSTVSADIAELNTNLSGDIAGLNTTLSGEMARLEAMLISRIQTLEQAITDNDVRGLNQKLAQLSTNMTQILEQQKVLLDLRSQVDKATTITDGLGDTLDTLQTEVDDIWKAYDALVDNPL